MLADPIVWHLAAPLDPARAATRGGPAVQVYGSSSLACRAVALLRHLFILPPRCGRRPGPVRAVTSHITMAVPARNVLSSFPRRTGRAGRGPRQAVTPLRPWSTATGCRTARPSSTTDWLHRDRGDLAPAARDGRPARPLRLRRLSRRSAPNGLPLYFKEVRVIGSNGFGIEEVGGVASTPWSITSTSSHSGFSSDPGHSSPLPARALGMRRS